MKAMSIVGIVLFSLCVILMIFGLFTIPNNDGALAVGFFMLLAFLYALAISIVGVVKPRNKKS